jgi:hypothetical protein
MRKLISRAVTRIRVRRLLSTLHVRDAELVLRKSHGMSRREAKRAISQAKND